MKGLNLSENDKSSNTQTYAHDFDKSRKYKIYSLIL